MRRAGRPGRGAAGAVPVVTRTLGVLLLVMAGSARAVAVSAAPTAQEPPVTGTADPKRAELHARLERDLALLTDRLDGVAGYLIRDAATGETFERHADAVFPVASVIKLPIYLELLRQAEEGTIDLARPITVDPKGRVEGGGVLEKWSEPYPALSAAQLAVLMMNFSDNYATNVLIDLVGMERVGRRLKAWGIKETLLRRKMMDLEAARAGRENVSTPRDMAALLERLSGGQALNASDSEQAIAVMKRNEKTAIKKGLPPDVASADKEGELDGVRCDVGIVFVPAGRGPSAPTRPLVIVLMTTYLGDDPAGEAYISDVTRAAYAYFHNLALASRYGRRIEP
ncbi:MAG TPA: serine hydrolase [Candidatus Polarisedimenticolia bacterium]|nr:serine hydrolase [Candidatus Polarisedimenticolia bacterium]